MGCFLSIHSWIWYYSWLFLKHQHSGRSMPHNCWGQLNEYRGKRTPWFWVVQNQTVGQRVRYGNQPHTENWYLPPNWLAGVQILPVTFWEWHVLNPRGPFWFVNIHDPLQLGKHNQQKNNHIGLLRYLMPSRTLNAGWSFTALLGNLEEIFFISVCKNTNVAPKVLWV